MSLWYLLKFFKLLLILTNYQVDHRYIISLRRKLNFNFFGHQNYTQNIIVNALDNK